MTTQGCGQFVRQLEALGMVEVSVADHDARARVVRITAAGRDALARSAAVLAACDEAWAAQVGPDPWRVFREVLEEVGVVVGEVTYLGNQPWPFPASLMLGFVAHALDPSVRTDDVEITDARWFTRGQLRAAATTGEVLLPGRISIAHRLVQHWYGEPLPEQEEWR